MSKIQLHLAKLYPAQLQVEQQARRFNVVCCGRRWGKTQLWMNQLIKTALQGHPTAWFSPSYRMLDEVWRQLQTLLQGVITRKSEQDRRLELVSGGVIDLWSLENADAGRSRKYALVVIDEAAFAPNLQEAWQGAIRPTLTDLKGCAWFLSTPQGNNYFKTLFDRGQDPQQEDWASWQMPTSANPFLDPDEIEAAKKDCSEAKYNQEYRACFLNSQGSVFRRVHEAVTTEAHFPDASHQYIIGCDWGRVHDYTVFVVLDADTGTLVAPDRSNHVDYTMQCQRLRALCERWQPELILAEQNSIGQPIIEQLRRDGLPVQPFLTTNASKIVAIEALALAFERGAIHILNDAVLINELLAYEVGQTASGLPRYGAPEGQHDDCVMALAIAWSAVAGGTSPVYDFADEDLLVPPFAIPAHWPKGYAIDFAAGDMAVIWGARNPANGTLFLYEACSLPEPERARAAQVLRQRCAFQEGVLDPEGHGRSHDHGLHLIYTLHTHYDLELSAVGHHPDSGVLEVAEQMRLGRVKIFATLPKCLEDLRRCRRGRSGQIVSEGASLAEAMRALIVSDIVRAPQEEYIPTPPRALPGSDEYYRLLELKFGERLGPNSWMR